MQTKKLYMPVHTVSSGLRLEIDVHRSRDLSKRNETKHGCVPGP